MNTCIKLSLAFEKTRIKQRIAIKNKIHQKREISFRIFLNSRNRKEKESIG
jgi:hypothetical protein